MKHFPLTLNQTTQFRGSCSESCFEPRATRGSAGDSSIPLQAAPMRGGPPTSPKYLRTTCAICLSFNKRRPQRRAPALSPTKRGGSPFAPSCEPPLPPPKQKMRLFKRPAFPLNWSPGTQAGAGELTGRGSSCSGPDTQKKGVPQIKS